MANLRLIAAFALVALCYGSWDSYIDNLIAQTKDKSGTVHADKVAIIALDGGSAWTTGSHANAWKLQGSEAANIARAFKSKDFNTFMNDGIRVEGTKYQFLREENQQTVFGKKKGEGAITMQATKTVEFAEFAELAEFAVFCVTAMAPSTTLSYARHRIR